MLHSLEASNTDLARQYFGFVILAPKYLDRPGIPHWEVLRLWGPIETAYRLIAIIIVQSLISCGLIMAKKQK